jgi:hypothetical protein
VIYILALNGFNPTTNPLKVVSVIPPLLADPNYHPVNLPSRYSVVLDTGTAREGVTTGQNPAVA